MWVMKMSLMVRTIQKEKEQIGNMLDLYKRQLDNMPKGSITEKVVGQNVYFYLKYRDGKKVFTDYLGKDGEKVQSIRSMLEKRRHIETMIEHLESEQLIANKVLGGKI